jgi:hypothetical protein
MPFGLKAEKVDAAGEFAALPVASTPDDFMIAGAKEAIREFRLLPARQIRDP